MPSYRTASDAIQLVAALVTIVWMLYSLVHLHESRTRQRALADALRG